MQEVNAQTRSEGPSKSKRVLISGASGLIGTALTSALRASGASVVALTRSKGQPNTIFWNPEEEELNPRLVSGFDAVIHLAGEPVGDGRWTTEKKEKIYNSRVHGTAVLAKALARADEPPRTFLCASGINYYPSSGDCILDESAPPGDGFLSKVCVGWEGSALTLAPMSRVVLLRIGVVLSNKGGTLAQMLPLFRLGLGGYAGWGDAYLSWITLDDLMGAFLHILHAERLDGPVNLVSPEAVTGRRFATSLGRALGRPAFFRAPTSLIHLVLGEFADETILSSVRAVPAKLLSDGFEFRSETIEKAFFETLKVNSGET